MKKILFCILSIFISVTLCFSNTAIAQTEVIGTTKYHIENPYSDVNWDTWKAYKACTHCHTTRSDGDRSPSEMVEKYYSLGYDILALTDHGTVSESWTTKQDRLAYYFWNSNTHKDVVSEERNEIITSGSDRGGKAMVQLPKGIEINIYSTNKCHVNSYFANCGHNVLGLKTWPEEYVKLCEDAGGICHLNHVGDWSGAKFDVSIYDDEFMERYSNLFINYSSLVGMEIVNWYDEVTIYDRILYDKTLMLTAPLGRNIFAFCEDDSHDYEYCGLNANILIMPDNSVASMRTSMETGAFFACSVYSYGENELGNYVGTGDFPTATRIICDDETGTITITGKDANRICMISDGKLLEDKSITDGESVTFYLAHYQDKLGSYVRFYLTGPGGICYIQPFLLTKTGSTISVDEQGNVKGYITLSLPEISGVNTTDVIVGFYSDDKFLGIKKIKANLKDKVILLKDINFKAKPDSKIYLKVFYLDENNLNPISKNIEYTIKSQ